MKLMFFFADMLRANRLSINNNEVKITPLDKLLQHLGGTNYSNCFTPGPDTPRSIASFFSGKLPKNNGCDTRTKWPSKFFLPTNISLLKLLQDLNFKQIAYMQEGISELFFPKDALGGISQFETLNESLESLKSLELEENVVFFVQNTDYHFAVDDFSSTEKADVEGNLRVTKCIEKILNFVNKDFFDVIVIFSDHGCKLADDDHSEWQHLNSDRTQILLFIHKKDEIEISSNDQLSSIMDVYPTILNILGIDEKEKNLSFDGENLTSWTADRYLIVEDYYQGGKSNRFAMDIGSKPNTWAVHSNSFSYFENLSGQYSFVSKVGPINEIDIKSFQFKCQSELRESSTSYESFRAQFDSISPNLSPLNLTKFNSSVYYSNGDKRQKNRYSGLASLVKRTRFKIFHI